VARRAINGANTPTDDLITDVGMLSITDDVAGMLRINLLKSSADGGCKSLINLPVNFISDCRGFISHSLFARLDFIAALILFIFSAKNSAKPTQRRRLSVGDITSGGSV